MIPRNAPFVPLPPAFYARSIVLSTLDSLSSISLTLTNRTTTDVDVKLAVVVEPERVGE